MKHYKVTVIIPTYNDSQRLHLCLDALAKQTYPLELLQVLVVDNNSTESCRPIVDQYPFATYLFEEQPGSYHARNAALAYEPLGEIIAFTDSDCLPEANWLEEAINALMGADDNVGAIGGHVEMFTRTSTPNIAELYDMVTGFDQVGYITKENFAVTANLVSKKSIIKDVGPFNADLKSSGDKDWCQRMVKKGYKIQFCKTAVVKHPARYSVSSIKTKLRRLYGGFYYNHLNKQKDKLFGAVGFIEALMPPVDKIRQLQTSSLPVPMFKKVQLVAFCYYLKFYTLNYRVRLMTGLEKNVEKL